MNKIEIEHNDPSPSPYILKNEFEEETDQGITINITGIAKNKTIDLH